MMCRFVLFHTECGPREGKHLILGMFCLVQAICEYKVLINVVDSRGIHLGDGNTVHFDFYFKFLYILKVNNMFY